MSVKRTCGGYSWNIGRAVKRGHREKARIQDEDGWWLAPRVAAAYLGRSQTTLAAWAESCPLLGGAGLLTREFESALGRRITYFFKPDLERIKAANARLLKVPEVPGYVYIEDAASELGVSIRTLRRLQASFGKRAKTKKVRAKSQDGRPLPRSYVPREFLDACKSKRSGLDSSGMLTVPEAAEILGVKPVTVHGLIGRGKLAKHPRRLVAGRGHYRPRTLLRREEVQRLRDTRAGDPCPQAFIGDAGTWLPRKLALERYPHIKSYILGRFADKFYSPLGRVIRAKPVTWPNGWKSGPYKRPLGFHADDLQALDDLCSGRRLPAETLGSETAETPTLPAEPEQPNKGGRPRSAQTAEVEEFCYEGHKRGDKLSSIRLAAERLFGNKAPKQDAHVTLNARRHAEKNGLPFTPRHSQKTP